MNVARLQAGLDQILATSRDRVILAVVSLCAITLPSAVMSQVTPFADTWLTVLIFLFAIVVVLEPGEQLGFVLMGFVTFHWLITDQAVTSPWAVALAASLFVFHTSVALMAVTPHTAPLDRRVVLRWVARSIAVLAATAGVWVLVDAFDRRDSPGNVSLSVLALAALSVLVVGFLSRSLSETE